MSSEITRLVDDLVTQMESGSAPAYRTAMKQLADTARAGGPESLTAAVEALAPLLPGLSGDFAMTAVLAGACVEWGASPMALIDVVPRRASEAMVPRRGLRLDLIPRGPQHLAIVGIGSAASALRVGADPLTVFPPAFLVAFHVKVRRI